MDSLSIPPQLNDAINSNSQSHLLSFLPYIKNEDQKRSYISQLEKCNFPLMTQLYSKYQKEQIVQKYESKDIQQIESQYSKDNISNKEEAKQKGYDQIAEGKVSLLILAGGLGSRLGFDKPKGMFNIGMPSNKTLFEYLSNRFLSIQLEAKEKSQKPFKYSTLLIMTSAQSLKTIESFFKENNYFHLKEENVVLFPQNEINALDLNGKVISLSPHELYYAPDGNGGCFTAIKQHNILTLCAERGIEFLNVISIDNPLYKVLDPLFIGFTLLKGKCGEDQMAAKFLKKTNPKEKVGNFLIYKNHPMMLDYMEIPEQLKEEKKDNGELKYNASNILDYLISVKFLKKILLDDEKYKKLINMFHIIKKKFNTCYIDYKENKVYVKENNDGLKFEIFFNSIFEFAEKEGLLLFQIEREEEFAPVKNHEGESSNTPSITKRMMNNKFKKWYKEAGGEIVNDSSESILEFSFLVSYDGNKEDFFQKNNIPKKIDMKENGGMIYFKNEKIEH